MNPDIQTTLIEQLAQQLPIQLPYQLVDICGADAEKFLQGQLSCDLSSLQHGNVTYATANTPKGRIYGLFKIARSETGFLIRISKACCEHFMRTISKYAVFFKCDIKVLHSSQVLLGNDSYIETPAYPWLNTQLKELWVRSGPNHDTSPFALQVWEVLECLNGIPELFPETQEHFILQQLNLQNLGAVSFKKGCYTGQEIIARMKYLGKLKKKMYLLTSDATSTILPGNTVLTEENGKYGEVVRAAQFDQGSVALAVLDINKAESGLTAIIDGIEAVQCNVIALDYNQVV